MTILRPNTISEVLSEQARRYPDKLAYAMLGPDEEIQTSRTYSELWRRAMSIAQVLRACCQPGERALLAYPQGVDFVEGFYGCLLAHVIAVPVHLPVALSAQRHVAKLYEIAAESQPSIVLTGSAVEANVQALLAAEVRTAAIPVLSTDRITEDTNTKLDIDASAADIAMLIYTSGSTAMPKGVIVDHGNLIRNLQLVTDKFGNDVDSSYVSWLPLYHDLGLVVVMLGSLYCGSSCYLMDPEDFISKPSRWLRAISRFGARNAGGPNFAFDLCVRKTPAAERVGLDLSHWRVAFNGAEPVRADTLTRFAAEFAPYGFRKESFYPCYGMAEATGIITGGAAQTEPHILTLDVAALSAGTAVPVLNGESGRTCVGCGHAGDAERVAVVAPDSGELCPEGTIGEVWVAGASIGRGYFRRPQESAETFGVSVVGDSSTRYLRTGDLGFLYRGDLFLTGRLKDLIISHGANHYPQDFEHTAERVHAAIRPGGCAAFAIEDAQEEKLGLIAEVAVDPQATDPAFYGALLGDLRSVLLQQYGLPIGVLALVPPRTLLKTTSGKIRRRATHAAFDAGQLPVLAQWRPEPLVAESSAARATVADLSGLAARDQLLRVRSWVVQEAAQVCHTPSGGIPLDRPLSEIGLDSLGAVELRSRLADVTGLELPPSLLFDQPTPTRLARYLLDRLVPSAPGNSTPADAPAVDASVDSTEPIALIAMACRFPGGVHTPAELWALLESARDVITEIPKERWSIEDVYSPDLDLPGKTYSRWGGFLGDVSRFDPLFFGIAPREASSIDPQQRLLLETTWEALEQAGIPALALEGSKTGVYIGVSGHEYAQRAQQSLSGVDAYSYTGTAHSTTVGRVSYALGLQGPNLAIDTACSSSLSPCISHVVDCRPGSATWQWRAA